MIECSSDVVRLVQEGPGHSYLACVLCVQTIAEYQRELKRPSTSAEKRKVLQGQVQGYEKAIKSFKAHISSYDAEIRQHQVAMAALQGKVTS